MEVINMAEMSEVKKFILGLSDKEIMTLFGMVDKKKHSSATGSSSGTAWYDKPLSGLDKEGERNLEDLKKQLNN